MSHESITINFSDQDISDDYFIHLEQVGFEEQVTLKEMADLVDEIFDLNPCVDTGEKEPEKEEEPEEVEVNPPSVLDLFEFDSLIQRSFALDICGMDSEGNFIAKLKVIPSVPGDPYDLKLDNGKVLSTVVTEENISNHITVESTNSVELFYPVVGEGTFEWGNSSTSTPEIIRTGNTLSWNGFVTGSLEVRYPTRYDLVEVVVYGTPTYEVGECKAICFYHGLVAELDIKHPEDIGDDADRGSYCDPTGSTIKPPTGTTKKPQWVTTRTSYKCVCSGEIDHYEYSNEADKWDKEISGILDQADVKQVAAAAETDPDQKKALLDAEAALRSNAAALAASKGKRLQQYQFPGVVKNVFGDYIDCGETTGDMNDPEFYLQECCVPPPFALPNCVTYYRKNGGGQRMDPDEVKNYQDTYGEDNISFVAVSPEDGDCGYTKYQQVLHSIDCCEDVLPLEWDPEYSPIVAPALYHFLGGKGPFTVHVTGEGFSLNRHEMVRKIEISDHWFNVYLLEGHCGAGSIKVTDVCDQELPKVIRSPDGVWLDDGLLPPNSDDLCGWDLFTNNSVCCSGPWTICHVNNDIPETGDCYGYYLRGLSYAAVYVSEQETENGGYKLVRRACSGHRNCVSMNCIAKRGGSGGTCTLVDPISSLSYIFLQQGQCWWHHLSGDPEDPDDDLNFPIRMSYDRYKWSCA